MTIVVNIDIRRIITMSKKIAVLGAGNGGYVMAADLTMGGHKVNFYELPEYAEKNLGPIIKRGGIEVISQDTSGNEIELSAGGRSGFAKISGTIGSDIQEAVSGVDIIMLVVPGFMREKFIRAFAPYLEDRQIITIWPGYFGALQCAKLLKNLGIEKDIAIAETESLFYNCSKLGDGKVRNKGEKNRILLSVFPGKKKKNTIDELKKIFPMFVPANNVLETTLANINPTLHPESVLLNLYRVERKFYPFDEKMNKPVLKAYDLTLGMTRLVKSIDMERLALGNEFELRINSLKKTLEVWYDAKGKDLYETILNCYAFQVQGAPTSLEDRYITEDIPYSLVPYTLLGEQIGVPVSTIRAMATIGCAITGRDFWKEGLDMESIGLKGKSVSEIIDYLE